MYKKFTKLLVFVLIVLTLGISLSGLAYADKGEPGYKIILDKTDPYLKVFRLKVSNLHTHNLGQYGKQEHFNAEVEVNGKDEANFHIWEEIRPNGTKCIHAWESKKNIHVRKCDSNFKDVLKDCVKKWSESFNKFIDGLTWAAVGAVFLLIIKWIIDAISIWYRGAPVFG